MYQSARIGIISISDRASQGVYEDKGLPALKEAFRPASVNLGEQRRGLIR